MAPSTHSVLLSPAELSYLHSSLSLTPPLRPDSRSSTQFRPLIAETEILPGTNGSARICFADGTEAIVGVKAEVEKSRFRYSMGGDEDVTIRKGVEDEDMGDGGEDGREKSPTEKGKENGKGQGENSWLEMTIEIPGFRDDDALPVFLAAMLNEALLADRELVDWLWINKRFHWKLYIDILLLSSPLSYPLPLLSLTTHLALLSTRLPALKSELDEDPLFNDDWDASIPLYPRATTRLTPNTRTTSQPTQKGHSNRPPITLLVMAVGPNILFDPSREELAVADAVLAISFTSRPSQSSHDTSSNGGSSSNNLHLLSIRTIDPPSRLTAPGIPDALNTATGGSGRATASAEQGEGSAQQEGVWRPPRGGMKRGLVGTVVKMVLEKGGVGEEVLEGLEGVDIS